MNALRVIAPYRALGMWVFDDPAVGLVQEPFVGGADTVLDQWSKALGDVPIRVIFSDKGFPGYIHKLEWGRAEMSGNWYKVSGTDQEAWLCPALFRYFESAPEEIFIRVEAI